MSRRHFVTPWAGLIVLLVLSACGRIGSNGLPTPIATLPPGQLTAAAAGRPTLPPTFTPSATWTVEATRTPNANVSAPTGTYTLTPTLEPSATRTLTRVPSITPTWTPDVRQLPPTATPRVVATFSSPFPGVTTPGIGTAQATGCTSSASAANLLQNSGFEGGASKPTFDDMEVPQNWIAFWKPEGTPVTYDSENSEGFRRPEMRVIQASAPFDNPPRVREGNQALYLFGGSKVFDAGAFQQVQVANGETFCLTGFAHAWSQHQSSDVTQSRLATDDDRRNVNFQLGIDPTGGTDPFAATVAWGPAVHLYDTYQPIPGAQAQALGTTITVFLRGSTLWRFEHNDLFFDDLRLVRLP